MPRFPLVLLLIAWILAPPLLRAAEELTYFAIEDAAGKPVWQRGTQEELKRRETEIFDSYTVRKDPQGGAVVERTIATPSGDWTMILKHRFEPGGKLVLLTSDFRTANGVDAKGEPAGPTRCLRKFAITPEGRMVRISERITDAGSGARVVRTFYHPEIAPWMALSGLPLPPR